MANIDYNVNINTTQGIQNLDRLSDKVGGLNTAFSNLKTAVAGIAFGAFIASAIRTADSIKDLSDSTGIAIANVVGFGKALQNFGGNSEIAEQGILRLVSNIGAAADGSAGLQASFARVGVSLNDLATLSEQDILAKVISGLGNVGDKSEQAFLKTELLGKQFRIVAIEGQALSDSYNQNTEAARKQAESIAAASDAYDKFEKSVAALSDSILIAITPVTEFIATLDVDAIREFGQDLVKLVIIFGSFTIVGKMVGVFASFFAVLGAGAVPLAAFTLAMSKFLLIGGALLAVIYAINTGLKLVFDVNLLKPFGQAFDAVKDKFKEFFGFKVDDTSKQLDKNTQAAINNANAMGNTGRKVREVKDPFEQLKKSISGVSDEYARLNQANINQIKLQTDLIGKGREDQEILKARGDLIRKEAEEIAKLEDRRSKLTTEQARAGLGKLIDKEIEKIREQTRVDMDGTESAIKNSQARIRAFDLEKFARSSQIDVEKQIRDIQFEMATMTMTEMEKKSAEIARNAQERAIAEIKAQEAARGSLLTEEEKQKYYDAAKKKTDEILRSQQRLYDKGRDFSTGWKRAFNDYVSNATNAARVAESMFKKFTSGIEDVFVNFVKTGKFEWKSFVQGMMEELLRSQIQQTMANLFKGFGGATDGIGGMLSGLLGGGSGDAVGKSANNPMYVIDISNGGASMVDLNSQQQGGGGFFDSIGKLGTSIFEGVSGLFSSGPEQLSGPTDSGGGFFSSIASGIGDLFGGFFANGGTLGAGKWGIAGEAGPELISGPANITPMGGGQNVTYNITATDAASFKALIAADPGFIHSVAMMGGSGVPSRR